jgi:L-fuconolactonase
MKIDCHQHFWKVSRGDYHWMTPGPPLLHRDFMPEDLLPILRQLNFDKTIVVQAAQTTAETDFLLDLASRCEFIAGVVGWLDLESPRFAEDLRATNPMRSSSGYAPCCRTYQTIPGFPAPRC